MELELGEGHAGAAVFGGCVYLLDYDQAAQRDVIRCLSLDDGREIWSRAYRVKIKRNHGMSRTVPAVSAKHVITLGPKCHVVCCDRVTGEYRWGMDLVRQFGTKVPPWYAGQCPLLDGDRLILAPGGSADDRRRCRHRQGSLENANPRRWEMTHLDPAAHLRPAHSLGASGGVGGDATAAPPLETDAWKISIATVPRRWRSRGRLLLTGGYEAGAAILQLTQQQGGSCPARAALPSQRVWLRKQTPIFYQGYIYGVPGGQLVCLDPSGRRLWASGSTHRFGLGPYLIADGLIYLMNDSGTLTLVEATPAGYHQRAQARILEGHDSWGPLALVGGRLLARDLTRMVCVDVSDGG